jgi:hypothetical protein
MDLLIADCLAVAIESAERLLPSHAAPVPTYLKHGGHRLGTPLNIDVVRVRDGMRRIAHRP